MYLVEGFSLNKSSVSFSMLYELQDSGPSTSFKKSVQAAALGKNSLRLLPPNARLRLVVTVCQKKEPASLYFSSCESSPMRSKPMALGTCVFACLLSRLSIFCDIGSNNILWEKRLAA